MTEIPDGMFCRTGLEIFEMPDRITKIGASVFAGCRLLHEIHISEGISEIPLMAFNQCIALKKMVFPEKVTTIADNAFSYSGLEECTIPDTITKIEKSAFIGCEGLADENGLILVNESLYGVVGYGRTKPLAIPASVKKIAISRGELPEIVYHADFEAKENLIHVCELKVGEEIEFGRFPETADLIMRPIKWKVLAIGDRKALLITTDSIFTTLCEQGKTWADSEIRALLNNGFYEIAFTKREQSQIVKSLLKTEKNKKFSVDGGNDTEDKVFLLSIEEVERYMSTKESRTAGRTEYTETYYKAKRDTYCWELRTPGKDNRHFAAIHNYDGTYDLSGLHTGYSTIRPAVWIQ